MCLQVFFNGVALDKSVVVDVWTGMCSLFSLLLLSPVATTLDIHFVGDWAKELGQVTSAGYNTVLSAPWYLNYISYGKDWPKYYNSDPHAFSGSDAQKQLVVGGEVPKLFLLLRVLHLHFIFESFISNMQNSSDRGTKL